MHSGQKQNRPYRDSYKAVFTRHVSTTHTRAHDDDQHKTLTGVISEAHRV